MASHDEIEEMNPQLEQISGNLSNFIDNINCLKETFAFSEGTLKQQLSTAVVCYNDFIKPYIIEGSDGSEFEIPADKIKEFEKVKKRKIRSEKAINLIPPSYVVSLISLFDSFFAGLIRCVYSLNPDKLKESNKQFFYRDIVEYGSVKEVKKAIIDSTIESELRLSHSEQFSWLENALGVKSLRNFQGWADFIEVTERRNLFVHSDGIVSSQYISECVKNKYALSNISVGSKLEVDKNYFNSSYILLYKMGIMLTQILINKLYIPKYTSDSSERDKILINNVYDLISEKQYAAAVEMSDFILNDVFKHTGRDRGFIILNKAQALKWAGDTQKCNDILSSEDTSTWNNELLIPKLTLEEQYEDVYPKMLQLGDSSTVLTKTAYCEWPIFKEIRKQPMFAKTFKQIFGVELLDNIAVKIEDNDASDAEALGVTE